MNIVLLHAAAVLVKNHAFLNIWQSQLRQLSALFWLFLVFLETLEEVPRKDPFLFAENDESIWQPPCASSPRVDRHWPRRLIFTSTRSFLKERRWRFQFQDRRPAWIHKVVKQFQDKRGGTKWAVASKSTQPYALHAGSYSKQAHILCDSRPAHGYNVSCLCLPNENFQMELLWLNSPFSCTVSTSWRSFNECDQVCTGNIC